MSWQANGLFVLNAEVERAERAMTFYNSSPGIAMHHLDWAMREQVSMDALLDMYDAHGGGWYLLSSWDNDDPDAYDKFDYDEFKEDLHIGYSSAYLPNPITMPGATIMRVGRAADLPGVAYEMVDNDEYLVAYAGDGEIPFEHMVIRGKEYDFSKEVYENAMKVAMETVVV